MVCLYPLYTGLLPKTVQGTIGVAGGLVVEMTMQQMAVDVHPLAL